MYDYIMTTMRRTQITLDAETRSVLDDVSGRTGASISSLIREAVAATYGDVTAEERLSRLRAGFGSWTAREQAGAEYVDSLRSGRRMQEILDR